MGDRSWMHDNDPMPVSRIDRMLSGSAIGNARNFKVVLAVILIVGTTAVIAAML